MTGSALFVLHSVVMLAIAQLADETNTGGGRSSTITAPNTMSRSTTKPRGNLFVRTTNLERSRIEREDDKIETAIGCSR